MTQLMEQPLLIAAGGIFLIIFLVCGWISSGNRAVLYLVLVAVLGVIGLLVAERLIKTEREQLEETIYRIADHVESNDVEAAVAYVHSQRSRIRRRAEAELPSYTFTVARITQVRGVSLETKENPPRARVEFNVRVEGTATAFGEFRVVRFVIVEFRKENDRWKVWNYEHHDFATGFKRGR